LGTQTTFGRKPQVLYYWLPPILWGLTVLVMSGNLGSATNTWGLLKWLTSWFTAFLPAKLNTINFYIRKTGHATAYGLMFFLWFRAFYVHGDFGPRRSLFFSLVMCLFLACMDEGHQLWLDMSGSVLAALITFAGWISRDYVGSRPMRSFWRRPHLLSYWLPPLLWTLAMLVMARGMISVDSTMGALKWFVSWFAVVNWFQLKILNLYLWKTGGFLAYGILYVLWFRAFQRHAGASLGGAFLLALGLCVLVFTMELSRHGHAGIWAAITWDTLLGLSGSCLAALITFAVMTPRNLVIPRSMRDRSKSWTSGEPGRGGETKPLITGQHPAGSE
jgi:VanZ family protein